MAVTFPLNRLPSLAIDNVIQVMEPIEQVLIYRTSERYKARVKRITKKLPLYLKFNRVLKIFYFGHDQFKLSAIIAIQSEDENKEYHRIQIRTDGRPVVYWYSTFPFAKLCKQFRKIFEPKTFVFDRPWYWWSEQNNPSNFRLTEEKHGENLITFTSCKKASRRIWESLFPDQTLWKNIAYRKADWICLDEILLSFLSVDLAEIKVTNKEVNEFLKKWALTENARLTRMTLLVHEDSKSQLDIQTILDGLGAVLIEGRQEIDPKTRVLGEKASLYSVPKYQIEMDDSRRILVNFQEDVLHFDVE